MVVSARLPRVVPHDLPWPFAVDNKDIPPGVSPSLPISDDAQWLNSRLDYRFNVRLHDAYERRRLGSLKGGSNVYLPEVYPRPQYCRWMKS